MARAANQGIEEMAAQLAESKKGNRLYKPGYNEVSAELKEQAIANAIDQTRGLLKAAKKKGRVNLDDVDELRTAADNYMQACKMSGTIPSMLGFCPSIGYSRQHVYTFISTKGNTASARFLDSLRSAWAAIFQQLAMTRVCSEPVAIFALKNSGQGMADRTDVDMNVTNNARAWYEDDTLSDEEFKARIMAYLDDGTTGDDAIEPPDPRDYEI